MFARQVDPLAEYSSAITAAEQQHRAQQEAIDQNSSFTLQSSSHTTGSSSSTCSSSNNNTSNNTTHNPYKRKHPLLFEPEFFAALDSALDEYNEEAGASHTTSSPQQAGSPWSARPLKKAKKSTLTTSNSTSPKVSPKFSPSTPPPTESTASLTPPSPKSPSGPSSTLRKHPPSRVPSCPSVSLPPLPHNNIFPKALPAFRQNLNGPSIIDLSSGEELVTLHLGVNEHKRKSENDLSPPKGSAESLQEVFEYQDDGTLQPISDHHSGYSPAKKVRLSKASHHPVLRFLKEGETEPSGSKKSTKRDQNKKAEGSHGACRVAQSGYWSGANARRKGSTFIRNTRSTLAHRFWDDMDMDNIQINSHNPGSEDHQGGEKHVEQNKQINEGKAHQAKDEDTDQCSTASATITATTTTRNVTSDRSGIIPFKAGLQAVIRYQEPKGISVSSNLHGYNRECWKNPMLIPIIPLKETKGKELVVYQKLPFAISSAYPQRANDKDNQEDEDEDEDEEEQGNSHPHTFNGGYLSTVIIEELDDDDDDDDDGNMADDEGCEHSDDAPLVELEEGIMDMDLD